MPVTHGEEALFEGKNIPDDPGPIISKGKEYLDKEPLTAPLVQPELSVISQVESQNKESDPLSLTENKNEKNKENNKSEILEQKVDSDTADQTKIEDANSLLKAVTASRRSFSGSSPKKNTSTASEPEGAAVKKEVKPEEAQSIFAKLKATLFPASDSASLNPGYTNPAISKAAKNLMAGLPSSWTTFLVIGLIIIFLLIKGFQTFYVASTSLAAHFNNTTTAPDGGTAISGRWQFAAKWNNKNCQGQAIIHQRDNQIFGQGIDYNVGQYKFNGSRTGNHLDLLKQYFVGNNFVGHPIELHGDLDPSSSPLFISGQFQMEYMQGGKWRGREVITNGAWEAQLVQPLIEDEGSNGNVPLIRKADERPSSVFANFFGSLSKTGGWIALAIIIFGVGGWHFASSLIGPDGWLGIWDKQKYVPAQFLSEHKKKNVN